jgi:hypothetical protein
MHSTCSQISIIETRSYSEDFKLKTRGFDEY